MAVRLTRAYNGQAANTIYAMGWTSTWDAATENVLLATGGASSNSLDVATDYVGYNRYQQGGGLASGGLPSGLAALAVTLSKLQNVTQTNTMNLREMLGGSLNTDKRGRIMIVGDSFLRGTGSNNQTFAGCSAKSISALLAKLFTQAGIPASNNYMLSNGGYTNVVADVTSFDPRITSAGAPTIFQITTLGGNAILQMPSGTAGTNKWIFAPKDILTGAATPFDRIDVLYAKTTAGSTRSFNVSIDGGTTAAATITSNDATGPAFQTVNVTAGSTVATLTNNALDTNIVGVGVYDSTKPGISIINGAIHGVSLNTILTTSSNYKPLDCVDLLLDTSAFNCTLLNGGANDLVAGRTIDQVSADLNTIIGRLKARGDVIFMLYGNISPAFLSQDKQDALAAAQIAACLANGIPYFDTRTIMPDYATAAAAGLFFDSAHYRGSGHGMFSRGMASAVQTI